MPTHDTSQTAEIQPLLAEVDVLYAEDDDAYARHVDACLARSGLSVRRARSRDEFLNFLAHSRRPPRCLLIDLALGDSSGGFFLCDALKRSPSMQKLPIVVITGTRVTTQECLGHGALHCIAKGSDDAALAAVLSAVIAQHERSQGFVDAGDLRFDPNDRAVSVGGRILARLAPGPFAALLLLIRTAPSAVGDEELYAAFRERHPYHHKDDLSNIRPILKNDMSRLRQDLGTVGLRIARLRNEGYAYRPDES